MKISNSIARFVHWMVTPVVTIRSNGITRFERWLLKSLTRRLVVQGPAHQDNITDYYRIMNDAARREFNEDNKPTLDDFLMECQEQSLGNFRPV